MSNKLPLKNIRVLDFGHVWAGPMVGGLLADMGAEVIKIESRTRLDLWRTRPGIMWKNIEAEKYELCPGFHNVNRNKLSITLNLGKPKAAELLKRLAKVSDVVNENMTPGTMKKLGFDYEEVKKVKEDIIYLSSSALGQYGELSNLPGYGPTTHAVSGFDYTIGYHNERPLGVFAIPFSDANTGLHGAFAILSALYYRNKTGEGTYIDLSEAETMMYIIGDKIIQTYKNKEIQPEGNYNPAICPNNFYPCKGEDQWVSIAIKDDSEWRSFCLVVNRPKWIDDERFADVTKRNNNGEILDKLISQWTEQYTPDEVVDRLQKEGIAVAPLLNPENFQSYPFYRKRSFIKSIHPIVGEEMLFGSPWKLKGVTNTVGKPAPSLGEHNDYVFGQILNFSESEIARLKEEEVIT